MEEIEKDFRRSVYKRRQDPWHCWQHQRELEEFREQRCLQTSPLSTATSGSGLQEIHREADNNESF